jgi:hypothetical protein
MGDFGFSRSPQGARLPGCRSRPLPRMAKWHDRNERCAGRGVARASVRECHMRARVAFSSSGNLRLMGASDRAAVRLGSVLSVVVSLWGLGSVALPFGLVGGVAAALFGTHVRPYRGPHKSVGAVAKGRARRHCDQRSYAPGRCRGSRVLRDRGIGASPGPVFRNDP